MDALLSGAIDVPIFSLLHRTADHQMLLRLSIDDVIASAPALR
jgi:hypothetical protein